MSEAQSKLENNSSEAVIERKKAYATELLKQGLTGKATLAKIRERFGVGMSTAWVWRERRRIQGHSKHSPKRASPKSLSPKAIQVTLPPAAPNAPQTEATLRLLLTAMRSEGVASVTIDATGTCRIGHLSTVEIQL